MEPAIKHYYGDIVRALFLLAAVIMLTGLPAIINYLNIPTMFSIAGMLVLALAAGLTNPKQIWGSVINAILSCAGFVIFETYAVTSFKEHGSFDKFFLSNISLGLIFLVAVYFSVKTLRGLLLNRQDNNN